MAITKAAILTMVNDRLNRSETNIDAEVIEAVDKLGRAGNFLPASTSIETTANDYDYAEPTRLREFHVLTIIGTAGPLQRISYGDWLRNYGGGVSTGEPQEYAHWKGQVYLWPIPDAAYTITVDYWEFHADSADNITFADKYRSALEHYVIMAKARNLQLYDDARIYAGYYDEAVRQLLKEVPVEPSFTKYHDI